MKFSVETWAPEYGVTVDESSLEESAAQVDLGIELAPSDWRPIVVEAQVRPDRILFVDGIQRVDARVWIHDGEVARPAVCATVAAGVVACTPTAATVDAVDVFRGLFAPVVGDVGPIVTRHATYQLVPVTSAEPEATYLALHNERNRLEHRVAAGHGCEAVIFDGPLRGRNDPAGVGYIKTHRTAYLPEDLAPVIGRLGDGERTPVFLLGGGAAGNRWTWYLRLPGPRSHPMSGVVRLELNATGTSAEAIARADLVSAALPRFASAPHKEPRAPQNLIPIAGLEHYLRRRLGDALVLERGLRLAAAS